MADTCSIITPDAAPKYSLLVEVDISSGYKQMLRPVDRATNLYASEANTSVATVGLAFGAFYKGVPAKFLYIRTDSPLSVEVTYTDYTTKTLVVNRVLVLDMTLLGFRVSNVTTGTTANAHIAFTGDLNPMTSDIDKEVILLSWAMDGNYRLVNATRNANDAVTTADVEWPDGTTGTYTADVFSTQFPGIIDAWHVTYQEVGHPLKTFTQPQVTRSATGGVTVQPAMIVS